MTNVDAMKLLSSGTVSLLREHAKIVGVDVAKLASDLLEMMARDAQNKRPIHMPQATGAGS